jgi:hypothetical protein
MHLLRFVFLSAPMILIEALVPHHGSTRFDTSRAFVQKSALDMFITLLCHLSVLTRPFALLHTHTQLPDTFQTE